MPFILIRLWHQTAVIDISSSNFHLRKPATLFGGNFAIPHESSNGNSTGWQPQ
jgi:hypothetical protein